jgi:hypothetical protein
VIGDGARLDYIVKLPEQNSCVNFSIENMLLDDIFEIEV